jgi:Zn-dependent protease
LAAFTSPPEYQIEQLANQARQLAATGQFEAARQQWQAVLQLLPADSPHRAGIQREISKLDGKLYAVLHPKPKTDWRKRLGPFGVVIAVLTKFKTAAFLLLTKGKFLFSMLAFLSLYWALFGWWFAVGLSACVLLHEMGHYVVVRLFGLKAELPMFLPGLGAYVKWQGANVDPGVRAQISLAGPLFGFISGLLAYGVFLLTHQNVWLAVAQFAGWMNLLNLTPIGMFDGGRAMDAIGKQQRLAILVLSVVLAIVLHQFVFGAVAAGTGYRLWKRDFPATASEGIGYYFAALAVSNGLLSWYCLTQADFLHQRVF